MGVDLTGAVAPAPGSAPDPEREATRPSGPGDRLGSRRGRLAASRLPGRLLALAGVVPSLLLAGWLLAVYPLVRTGAARPLPALAVAVPVVATLVFLVRRLPAVPRTPWWAVLATLAVAAGFAAFAASKHGEQVVLRRDPAVYALTAHWLADHGGLSVPTDAAAAGGPSPTFISESPGFYQVGGDLVPQFMSGAALSLLPGAWLGDWTGIFTAPAVYAALSLLAAAGLVGRLVGPRWAPVGALVLGLSQPMMLAARTTLSEPAAQLLLLGGLCLLVDAVDARCPRGNSVRGPSGHVLAALAGVVIGLGLLVRIEAARESLLLVLVIGWLAARRRSVWLPLAAGLVAATGYGVLDAVGPSWPYVSDLGYLVRPLLALGALLTAGTAVAVVAVRRGLPRGWRNVIAGAAAVLVAAFAAFLFVRPWVQTGHMRADATTPILAGMQRDQGLPVDGTRSYAEESLRWVSWYVGWSALAAAGVAAIVLVWRTLRQADDRWAVTLPVPLASAALVLYKPAITPDHPWADRRLVPTVLPLVILLAVFALAAVVRTVRRHQPPAARGRLTHLVAVGGVAVLAVPALLGSWRLATTSQTEAGEPAAVQAACSAFAPGEVALLVDARTRQEWLPALRQVCDVPTFGVPGDPTDDTATRDEVDAVVARVRAAGGQPVLVAQSGSPLPRLTSAPQRQVVGLSTTEHSRLLTRRADRVAPLTVELWVAPAG